MAGGCGCEVEARRLQARQHRVLWIVLLLNAATFVLMVAAALSARSTALLSGALDNLGDAITYGLSLAVLAAGAAVWWTGAAWPDLLVAVLLLGVFLRPAWRVSVAARQALARAGSAVHAR